MEIGIINNAAPSQNSGSALKANGDNGFELLLSLLSNTPTGTENITPAAGSTDNSAADSKYSSDISFLNLLISKLNGLNTNAIEKNLSGNGKSGSLDLIDNLLASLKDSKKNKSDTTLLRMLNDMLNQLNLLYGISGSFTTNSPDSVSSDKRNNTANTSDSTAAANSDIIKNTNSIFQGANGTTLNFSSSESNDSVNGLRLDRMLNLMNQDTQTKTITQDMINSLLQKAASGENNSSGIPNNSGQSQTASSILQEVKELLQNEGRNGSTTDGKLLNRLSLLNQNLIGDLLKNNSSLDSDNISLKDSKGVSGSNESIYGLLGQSASLGGTNSPLQNDALLSGIINTLQNQSNTLNSNSLDNNSNSQSKEAILKELQAIINILSNKTDSNNISSEPYTVVQTNNLLNLQANNILNNGAVSSQDSGKTNTKAESSGNSGDVGDKSTLMNILNLVDANTNTKNPVQQSINAVSIKNIPMSRINQSLHTASNLKFLNAAYDKKGKDSSTLNELLTLQSTQNTSSNTDSTTNVNQAPAAPVPMPNEDIMNQIVNNFKVLKLPDITELKVKLKPDELGEITVKVSLEKGLVNGSITTDNKHVANMIQAQMDGLKAQLINSNINLNSLSVNVSNQNDSDNQNSRQFYRQEKRQQKAYTENNIDENNLSFENDNFTIIA